MKRDEVIAILGEGATDEQVKAILDKFHEKDNELRTKTTELAKSQSDLAAMQGDLATVQGQLDEINKAKMNEQEKIAADKEEAAKYVSESKKVYAKAKATEILASVGITDEELIKSLVSDNVELTEANANIYVENIKKIKEDVEKKTREEIANADLKPNPSNSSNNSDGMTWEKYTKLSEEEQSRFAQEHPEEFAKL